MNYDTFISEFQPHIFAHKIPISGMTLTKFDMKKGNVLVWSKVALNNEMDLTNIEFKTLPSGIHNIEQDIINFVIPKGDNRFYYGIALFHQNGVKLLKENPKCIHLDRNKVSMYSLSIIVDPEYKKEISGKNKFYQWGPNTYLSANEYLLDLQTLLPCWLKKKDTNLLNEYFKENCRKDGQLQIPYQVNLKWKNNILPLNNEYSIKKGYKLMLMWLPKLIIEIGPLLFPLLKACLLRERIFIVVSEEQSFEKCNSLCYCLSVLSLMPKVLEKRIINTQEPLQSLFTVGVCDLKYFTDIVSNALTSDQDQYNIPGFIACTSDEILMYKNEVYDKVLKFSKDDTQLFTNDKQQIKATPHDWETYELLLKTHLFQEINTDRDNKYLVNVESISLTQYFIDGFYWWATAGYLKPSYHELNIENIQPVDLDNNDLDIVLSIVGYFHDKIILIFDKLEEKIQQSSVDEIDDTLIVSPFFLAECGLDCFSNQDYEFMNLICMKWFQKSIKVKPIDFRLLC